ncbi:acyl-CoA carboxylase subunit epsilon [Streptomyces sp. NPDC046716]|uniref:acyl-CoA carboxylase subunit epsilon n=1 Tax=Streptomyces sp. NPDC046716 TaxID=3157093 RepID=UPI0033F22905
MDEPTGTQPVFAVVRGRPDEVELAALTAVLLVRLRGSSAPDDAQEAAAGAAPRAPWSARRRPRPRVGWSAPA